MGAAAWRGAAHSQCCTTSIVNEGGAPQYYIVPWTVTAPYSLPLPPTCHLERREPLANQLCAELWVTLYNGIFREASGISVTKCYIKEETVECWLLVTLVINWSEGHWQ